MYTDKEKAAALVKLAANKLDFWKTAEQTKISHMTLRRWYNSSQDKPVLKDELENALIRILSEPPKLNGKDWAITVGILADKLQMMNGLPVPSDNPQTNITLGINNTNVNAAELLGVTPEELAVLIIENQKLLRGMRKDEPSETE